VTIEASSRDDMARHVWAGHDRNNPYANYAMTRGRDRL